MATQRLLGMEGAILMWVCMKATPVCHQIGRYYHCFTGVKIYVYIEPRSFSAADV